MRRLGRLALLHPALVQKLPGGMEKEHTNPLRNDTNDTSIAISVAISIVTSTLADICK